MVDITQVEDIDIRSSVDAFEAALKSKATILPLPKLERILLAVDQSNQGETAERFAAAVAQSHNARVMLLYAYEGVRDAGREEYLSRRAAALSGLRIELEPLEEPVRTEHGKRSFEQILASCEKKRCDLIVIPAPYLDDYVKLGQESVGANLDMLLCRAATALLVVREPQADPQRCLANLLLPVAPYEATAVKAAGWALKLMSQNGLLRVLAIAETARAQLDQQVQERNIIEMEAEKFAGLYRPELAGLVAALQRRAAETGIGCRLINGDGEPVQAIADAANNEDALLVLASSPDPRSLAQMRTAALVRVSRNPVLVVR